MDENKPTLVTHIPPVLYERYQAAERMMWKLRTTDKGKWQTNIRIGRRDLQIRYRQKGDKTNWKNIPLVKIPDNFPKPQYELLKKSMDENKPTLVTHIPPVLYERYQAGRENDVEGENL